MKLKVRKKRIKRSSGFTGKVVRGKGKENEREAGCKEKIEDRVLRINFFFFPFFFFSALKARLAMGGWEGGRGNGREGKGVRRCYCLINEGFVYIFYRRFPSRHGVLSLEPRQYMDITERKNHSFPFLCISKKVGKKEKKKRETKSHLRRRKCNKS